MVESEGEEAPLDSEIGRAGSSMQPPTQDDEEEKEEEYEPFDCMYAMLERFMKVSNIYSRCSGELITRMARLLITFTVIASIAP